MDQGWPRPPRGYSLSATNRRSGLGAKVQAPGFGSQRKSRVPSSRKVDRDLQIIDVLAGFCDDQPRHDVAMAVAMVAFKTQQAASLQRRQRCRVGQSGSGLQSFHVSVENRNHALWMARPNGISAGFRRAEALEVKVPYPHIAKTGGELTFRETGFTRRCHSAYIDHEINTGLFHRGQHRVNCAAFIADGQQIGRHEVQPCASQSSIRRRAMLSTRGNWNPCWSELCIWSRVNQRASLSSSGSIVISSVRPSA